MLNKLKKMVKMYTIYKMENSTKSQDIDLLFNTLDVDFLVLDFSTTNVITSDIIAFVIENKERVAVYKPTQRVSTILTLLNVLKVIKVWDDIPVEMKEMPVTIS